jgi:hypothetical protein
MSLTSPTNSPSPSNSAPARHKSGGAIAGGVIGGLAALGLLAALALFLLRRRAMAKRSGRGPNREFAFGTPGGGSGAGSLRQDAHGFPDPSWFGGAAAAIGASPRNGAQRLGSVGGGSAKGSLSPDRSGEGGLSRANSQVTSRSRNINDDTTVITGDSYGHSRGYSAGSYSAVAAAAALTGGTSPTRSSHRRSSSKTSFPVDDLAGGVGGIVGGQSRTSYDLSVFNSNASARSNRQSETFPPPSPSAAETTTRVARKPAPKYDTADLENAAISTGKGRRVSKPPVSGLPAGAGTRTRRYSSTSTSSKSNGGVGGELVLPAEISGLVHKDSTGTLGGAFKFAGEKEGPVHYLIPDLPASPYS